MPMLAVTGFILNSRGVSVRDLIRKKPREVNEGALGNCSKRKVHAPSV